MISDFGSDCPWCKHPLLKTTWPVNKCSWCKETLSKSPEKRSASERLKEIEGNQFGRACSDDGALPKWYYEIEFLVARVKRLEAALEKMKHKMSSNPSKTDSVEPCAKDCGGCIARKALGEQYE